MSEQLLTRIRKLNWMLSESATGYVSFDELCEVIGEMLESNIYVLNKKGKVLAAKYNEKEQAPLVIEKDGKVVLPAKYNDKFMEFRETRANLIYDSIKEVYGDDYALANKYHVIVLIIFGGKKMATLLLARPRKAYSEENVGFVPVRIFVEVQRLQKQPGLAATQIGRASCRERV